MDRRAMLGVMGATAGLAALAGREALADDKMMAEGKLDPVHKECLKACGECAIACDMAFHHCYMQVAEGKRDHAKPLHYVADCSGFCSLSACNIAKHSPLMAYSCMACAESCKATLAVISKFDSEEMKDTAKALAKCEESCRKMLEAMGHHAH